MVGHFASQASAVFKPKAPAKASSYQTHARTPKVENIYYRPDRLGQRGPLIGLSKYLAGYIVAPSLFITAAFKVETTCVHGMGASVDPLTMGTR